MEATTKKSVNGLWNFRGVLDPSWNIRKKAIKPKKTTEELLILGIQTAERTNETTI